MARNLAWLSQFDAGAKVGLYTEAFRREVAGPDAGEIVLAHQRGADAAAFLDRVLAADVATYLPDCLLVKVDMATMAHGLEARSPFLDHTLMEFAARLPAEVKLRRVEAYLAGEGRRRRLAHQHSAGPGEQEHRYNAVTATIARRHG